MIRGLARRKGHDGNFTAGPTRFLIACIDSGTASHRVAAGVLGTRNQRGAPENRGGLSAFIWPLRGRPFLCHFWIRDGLFVRTSVRTARRSHHILRQALGAYCPPLLAGNSSLGLVRGSIRIYEGPSLAHYFLLHTFLRRRPFSSSD